MKFNNNDSCTTLDLHHMYRKIEYIQVHLECAQHKIVQQLIFYSGCSTNKRTLHSIINFIFRAECKLVARTTKCCSVVVLTLEPKSISARLKKHHKNYSHITSIGMFGFLLRVCYCYSLLCRYSFCVRSASLFCVCVGESVCI